ncbi:DNA repair protein RecO [Aurantiacibacter zhengii]|uniref:DNA repair protein RecO n=1 Tax=Aurantiacibacter zhengii TaxID=2307003 RepID=A0A418NX94_9SPHN|nr:recombination protein O N-terminal domain-containing protein [Aurantiacibacter zhengii]RIV89234.1 DNA recombination protein RecO [Aurantiacibacter zhengii]
MHVRAPAILIAARQHGETAVVARFLTEEFGVVAGYVAGGRGRNLRPVMIPGNAVDLQLSARSASQLPFAKVELTESRGPWLAEPLPAAAIGWITALTASALPEREPYSPLFNALEGTLSAICHAPSARGWASALVGYEVLLLRELGYGGAGERPPGEMGEVLEVMDALGPAIDHYLLADRRADVMAARNRLRELLGRIA